MRLPESVLPVNNIETDYVDTDAEGDPEFVENEELKEAVNINKLNFYIEY